MKKQYKLYYKNNININQIKLFYDKIDKSIHEGLIILISENVYIEVDITEYKYEEGLFCLCLDVLFEDYTEKITNIQEKNALLFSYFKNINNFDFIDLKLIP